MSENGKRFEVSNIPGEINDLLNRMLIYDPLQRATIEELYETTIDWDPNPAPLQQENHYKDQQQNL